MGWARFGSSVNPIPTKGDRLCPPNYWLPTQTSKHTGISAASLCKSDERIISHLFICSTFTALLHSVHYLRWKLAAEISQKTSTAWLQNKWNIRATTANFWQARPPQWWPNQPCVRHCRRFLFCKIQARPRPWGPCQPWRPWIFHSFCNQTVLKVLVS